MNTARTIRYGVIATIMAALCAAIAVPSYAAYEDSLKGYWKLDDLIGSTTAADSAGSNTGTLYGEGSELMSRPACDTVGSYFISSMGASLSSSSGRLWVTETTGNTAGVYEEAISGAYNSFSAGERVKMTVNVNFQNSGLTYLNTRLSQYYNSTWNTISANQILYSGNNTIYFTVTSDAIDSNVRSRIVNSGMVSGSSFSLDNWSIKEAGPIFETGKTGNGASLDGTNDYIKTSASMNGYTDATVAAWFKPSLLPDPSDYRAILGNYYVGQKGLELYYDKDEIRFGGRPYATDFYSAGYNGQLETDSWYYVVGVKEDDLLKLYINGIKYGETDLGSDQAIQADSYTYIGSTGGPNFNGGGTVDDAALWSRALDANEISMLYDLGTEKFEWLTIGINDANELDLGYSTSELKLLAELYASGDTNAIETIDDLTWHYLSGDLPGDIGGTTYDYGDTWIYDGRYYIKLGSGLEGAGPVPEPGCAFGLLAGFFVPGFRRLLKRRVRG